MMRRPSAIKLLRANRGGEVALQRFEREVQLTARLTHPNTITIFDYGRTADGVFYYAMELLDGATLERIVALDGPQAAGRVVRILTMACRALSEAHSIGLIHRDIKPANIMLCTQGGEHDVVKMLDFGLVKDLEVDEDVKLTGASAITGTPAIHGSGVHPRTRLRWPPNGHLCARRGRLLSARRGSTSSTESRSSRSSASTSIRLPSRLPREGVKVPADLEAVVLACLSKDPSGRPQSAAELRRKIEACNVEPWESDRAEAWWREHRSALDHRVARSTGRARTIAVAGLPATGGPA